MNLDLEIKVIKTFVVKDKQARYIQFVSSGRTRWKFTQELSHFRDFRWELFEEVIKNESELIKERLQMIGDNKSNCYVISDHPHIDQSETTVSNALEKIIGHDATILVFGDAAMIYYEGEPPKNRYISKLK